MKKVFLIILTFSFFSSCSLFKTDTEQLQEKTQECINKIDTKGLNSVSLIQTETSNSINEIQKVITDEMQNVVKNANADFATLVGDSIGRIKEETNVAINNAIKDIDKISKESNDKIQSATKKSNLALFLAAVAFLFSVIALALSILAKGNYKVRTEEILEEVNDKLSSRIQLLIEEELTRQSKKQKSSAPYSSEAIQKEIRSVLKSLNNNNAFNIDESKSCTEKMTQPSATQDLTANKLSVPASNTKPEVKSYLYARDSTTNILSDVSKTHLVGKTIYKLILDAPTSTTAEIDLNLENSDVKKRVLGVDNSQLDQICDIHRFSNTPVDVIVKKRGHAHKMSASTWIVNDKIEIELK